MRKDTHVMNFFYTIVHGSVIKNPNKLRGWVESCLFIRNFRKTKLILTTQFEMSRTVIKVTGLSKKPYVT